MGKKVVQVVAVLAFLCGLGFFLYPKATEWYAAYENEKAIEGFEEDLTELQSIVANDMEEVSDTKEESSKVSKENLEKLYNDMESYNQQLYKEGQKKLKDPFAYEVPSFDLKEYGFQNNMIGTIEIPKIEVKLPMYLGANSKNMTKGAVVLGETSMPLGGENTNVVIAAHRGYKGIPMFREIEKIETGDMIQIVTPWDVLTYQVTEQKVVLPDEIDQILIQDEKDMITLLTCHPYTKNTHRYLVYAERCENQIITESSETTENTSTESEKYSTEETENSKATEDGVTKQQERSQSEEKIWLETYLPIIGGSTILLLIILGLVLTRKKR